jgi:hypothetical protein
VADAVETEAVEAPPESAQEPPGGDAAASATSDPGTGADTPTVALAVREPDEVYRVMDAEDEQMILDELQGRALGTMLYSFTQGGSKVTDLSYAGVLECIRRLNAAGHQIRVAAEPKPDLAEVVEDDETYYRAVVYAFDERTGMGQFGLARQAKHKKKRNGKTERDAFAETIALNKAQRNALRSFVPEEWRQTLIGQYAGDESRVRRLRAVASADAGKMEELPPPLDDDEAMALVAEIRGKYDELKGISRLALTPAKFNAYMTQAQHDHGRLRDFSAHLDQLLDEAKAKAGQS